MRDARIRVGDTFMVPACADCEEPGKCAVFGCVVAHTSVAHTTQIRSVRLDRELDALFIDGHRVNLQPEVAAAYRKWAEANPTPMPVSAHKRTP